MSNVDGIAKSADDIRRAGARRTATVFALIAAGIYAAFILTGVFGR